MSQNVEQVTKDLQFGLTKLDDTNSHKMEIEAFKLKITGTALMAFLLKLLDGFLTKMDSADVEEERLTVFGRTRQFVKAQYDLHPHQKSTPKDDPEYADYLFRLADHYLEKKAYFDLQSGALYEKIYDREDAGDEAGAKKVREQQAALLAKSRESSKTAARVYKALVMDPAKT